MAAQSPVISDDTHSNSCLPYVRSQSVRETCLTGRWVRLCLQCIRRNTSDGAISGTDLRSCSQRRAIAMEEP